MNLHVDAAKKMPSVGKIGSSWTPVHQSCTGPVPEPSQVELGMGDLPPYSQHIPDPNVIKNNEGPGLQTDGIEILREFSLENSILRTIHKYQISIAKD